MMRVLLLSLLLPVAALAQSIAEPDGFRTEQYRSPVPETLEGATVIDADAAHALWKTGRVVFVDVLPRPPKPENLPEGTIWRDKPRHSIPDAIWLPNVGFGELADVTTAYFENGLNTATGGDKTAPIVVFCLGNCWMSWNAAKRAIEKFGYSNVFWFPDGTDGWISEGHSTQELNPEP